jgi:hypothetical protein
MRLVASIMKTEIDEGRTSTWSSTLQSPSAGLKTKTALNIGLVVDMAKENLGAAKTTAAEKSIERI